MVSFDTSTGYVGQVAYREQTYERMVERWRGMRDYDYNGEAKYAFMHRHCNHSLVFLANAPPFSRMCAYDVPLGQHSLRQ